MSAFLPLATTERTSLEVRFVPQAEVQRTLQSRCAPRERQVFELVVRGKTNKHVANALGTTERTIKAHRQRVMEKMQVRSLVELVSLAERVGVFASASEQTA